MTVDFYIETKPKHIRPAGLDRVISSIVKEKDLTTFFHSVRDDTVDPEPQVVYAVDPEYEFTAYEYVVLALKEEFGNAFIILINELLAINSVTQIIVKTNRTSADKAKIFRDKLDSISDNNQVGIRILMHSDYILAEFTRKENLTKRTLCL